MLHRTARVAATALMLAWAAGAAAQPKPGEPPPFGSPIMRKVMKDRAAGNRQAALADLQQGVAAGDADAQAMLGELYRGSDAELLGLVPVDYAKSLELSRAAVAQGNTRAMTDLGVAYMRGHGVAQDGAKALAYLKQADAAHDRKSARYIGLIYEQGIGVPVDDAQAFRYYQQDAQSGDITGQCLLGSMYERGLGVPQDSDQAADWYTRSTQRGDVVASGGMLALGNLYETRTDAKRNLTTAASWYQRAAAAQNPTAQAEVDRLAAGKPLAAGTVRNICLAGHPG